MSYEAIVRQLLGLACLLAPALQVLSALLYLAGSLAWEAVVGMYAWTLSVAMYQGVALTIGRSKPVYGAAVAVIGFLNTVGVGAYMLRLAGLMMVELGLFENQGQIWDLPSVVPAFLAYGLLGLLGALTPAICAVGLLQARAIPAWAAGALVAFIGRPDTRLFGEPTYGLPLLVDHTPLSDGAELFVSGARSYDRMGTRYDEPIAPDELVTTDWLRFGADDDPVIAAALAWLATQPACGG